MAGRTVAAYALGARLLLGASQRRVAGFTRRYGCKLLVWFEAYDDLQQARLRELQMKKW